MTQIQILSWVISNWGMVHIIFYLFSIWVNYGLGARRVINMIPLGATQALNDQSTCFLKLETEVYYVILKHPSGSK